MTITIALPKGRLFALSRKIINELFGIEIETNRLSYEINHSELGKINIKLLKIRDIPFAVMKLGFDIGITYGEWLIESNFDGIIYSQFSHYQTKIALINSQSKRRRFATSNNEKYLVTEFPNIAQKYLNGNSLQYKIIKIHGSGEAYLPDNADLLIDCIETGKTLDMHKLQIIDILDTNYLSVIVSNQNVLDKAMQTIEKISTYIEATK